jgi:hypothetical protein
MGAKVHCRAYKSFNWTDFLKPFHSVHNKVSYPCSCLNWLKLVTVFNWEAASIPPLFMTSALDEGEWSALRALSIYSQRKRLDRYHSRFERWGVLKNSCPYRETNPDSAVRSPSLHRLSYPGKSATVWNSLGLAKRSIFGDDRFESLPEEQISWLSESVLFVSLSCVAQSGSNYFLPYSFQVIIRRTVFRPTLWSRYRHGR